MKSPEYMNKNCKVCSEHFESIMFLNDLKNRLQPTAVPTIVNVANPPQRVTSKRPRPVNRSHPGIGSSDSRTKTRKLAEECTSAQPTSTPATDCKYTCSVTAQRFLGLGSNSSLGSFITLKFHNRNIKQK